jgi:hypothetical protein
MSSMTKQKYFTKLIKTNRKLLLSNNFTGAMLTYYAQGKKVPYYETAQRIASILGISVMDIPWIKVERNS